jgi:DNA-binding GntR family transcriptional regulator
VVAIRETNHSSLNAPAADTIAAALRAAILSGEIAAGEPLRQDAVADRFGVSHIPVREALRHLAAQGLVTIRANRGAIVSRLSADEAKELLEIRCVLETQAVRWALPRAEGAIFNRAEAALTESERTKDVARWMEINWRFHSTLYERADRPRLLAMIESLNAQIDRFIRVLITGSDYRKQAQEEHRAILAAYKVRNAAAVSELLEQHMTETARLITILLQQYRHEQDGSRGPSAAAKQAPNR